MKQLITPTRIVLLVCLLVTVAFTLFTYFITKDDPYKSFNNPTVVDTSQTQKTTEVLPQKVVNKTCTTLLEPNSKNIQFVETNIMSIENGELNLAGIINDGKELKLKEGMVFDVMNEYGYIAQACIAQANYSSYEFELTVISDSVRASLIPTLSQRKASYINVFLVYPSDPKRKNINIEVSKDSTNNNLSDFYYTELVSEKVFNTLPKKIQNWHWIFKDHYEVEVADEYKESMKKWLEVYTDLDGDGEIDLVSLEGPCNGTSQYDLSCSRVLRKVKNVWKQIYFQTPA
jgi:hypothetical protein